MPGELTSAPSKTIMLKVGLSSMSRGCFSSPMVWLGSPVKAQTTASVECLLFEPMHALFGKAGLADGSLKINGGNWATGGISGVIYKDGRRLPQ